MDQNYQKLIKSTKSLESQNGYFWWKFSNFLKTKKNLVYFGGNTNQIRGNLDSDTIWWRLVPIFMDLGGGIDELEEQGMNTRTQRGENTKSTITSK